MKTELKEEEEFYRQLTLNVEAHRNKLYEIVMGERKERDLTN